MKIVVTGGYGFIGSSFVNLIGRTQPSKEIVVVDKLTYAANKENVAVPHFFLQKDICDVTSEDLGDFDYIVNFAAESHVDNSIKDGSPFIKTNIEGTFNLLEISKNNTRLKKFVQISTDEVYGSVHDHHESGEFDRLRPSSYYSATKASADLLVESVGHTFKMPYLITRTCNNFGVYQHKEKFIPIVTDCFKNDKPIPLYGDGQHIREWIWVEDNVVAILHFMLSQRTKIWNIGSGDRHTNWDVLKMFSKHFNKPISITPTEDRLGHDRRYALETLTDVDPFITKMLEDYINEL